MGPTLVVLTLVCLYSSRWRESEGATSIHHELPSDLKGNPVNTAIRPLDYH
jgi:hypothetical protein